MQIRKSTGSKGVNLIPIQRDVKFITTIMLVCHFPFARPQSVPPPLGARATGIGQIGSVIADEGSLFGNSGALGRLEASSVFFSCLVRPSIPGANQAAASISLLSRFGVAGIGVASFGDEVYSEQTATAGFANKLGLASLGISASLIQFRAGGHETRNALSINCGGIARITNKIVVGAYIVNINQAVIAPEERLPVRLIAGIGFYPEEHVLIAAEVEKHIDFTPTWKGGLEYVIRKKIFFRTGFNINPNSAHGGIGVKWRRLRIDFSTSFNRALGGVYQASAVWRLKQYIDK